MNDESTKGDPIQDIGSLPRPPVTVQSRGHYARTSERGCYDRHWTDTGKSGLSVLPLPVLPLGIFSEIPFLPRELSKLSQGEVRN